MGEGITWTSVHQTPLLLPPGGAQLDCTVQPLLLEYWGWGEDKAELWPVEHR